MNVEPVFYIKDLRVGTREKLKNERELTDCIKYDRISIIANNINNNFESK